MVKHSWSFRYKALFDTVVVVASYAAGIINKLIVAIPVLGGLLAVSVFLSYKQYLESVVQPESKELTTVIEDNILPQLKDDLDRTHAEVFDFRINVMILRWRNLPFSDKNRPDVRFWEKTLKIEASLGDYDETGEDELEWKTDEGAVGRAINERAQEIWAPIEYYDIDRIAAGWNMTEAQARRTQHLNSLLCVPIYLQSDDEKIEPVGVLNIDSEEPLDVTQFACEDIREKAIGCANNIGAIIQ